jgi:hypothetical protein
MERAPPPPFLCPINQDVMETPVVGPDGWSYDRAAIEQALRRNPLSPITRQPMTIASLTPNYALRDAIEAWRREQPMAIDPDRLTLDNPERVIARGSFGKVSWTSRTLADVCELCTANIVHAHSHSFLGAFCITRTAVAWKHRGCPFDVCTHLPT